MSLRHAILGILNHREMHGYQIKCVLEQGISTFWPVKLAAIYPGLRRLEEEGLVAWRREAGADGRPDRKVYAITKGGQEELARWRRLPPEGVPSVRNPLYLKLLFATEADLPEALSWVDDEIRGVEERLEHLRAELPRAFSTFIVKFMRESGVAHLELQRALLEDLRGRLRQRVDRAEGREPARPPRRGSRDATV